MRMHDRNFPSKSSFFDRFFNDDLLDWDTKNFAGTDSNLPAVNVKENDDEFRIEVAAPGMKKEDFNVKLENDRLTISSEKEEKKEEKDKDEEYTRREFSYTSFQRSFTVPEKLVQTEKIKASYKDGILNVVLPKQEEAKPKPARKIDIL